MMTVLRTAALPACAVLISVTTFAGAPDVRTLRNLKFSTIAVPGASVTEVAGSNNAGDIVGTYRDGNGQGHGFLLRGGSYTTIDINGAILTILNDINDAGDIVGTYYVDATAGQPFGDVYGFLLTAQGQLTTISYPEERVTWTAGINNHAQIVGSYSRWNGDQPLGVHGFLWESGVFTAVDVPGPPRARIPVTYASGINDHGDIVGGYNEDDIFETRRGFFLRNGVYSQVDVPGSTSTDVFAVNSAGEMVGEYTSDGQLHSFLFRPGGRGFYRLTGTGNPKRRFRSLLPLNINDSGHIVGSGSTSGGPLTGFLAIPPAGWL